jgi:hypothetical protein
MLLGRAVAASANSDCLYLSAMYRDIFVDRVGVRAWHAQPAPSFFPDLPLYFLLRALTGSPTAALWAYAAAELSFGVVALVEIARLLEVPSRRAAWSLSFFSMSALAYVSSRGEFFHLAFSPSCHASCVWVSVGSGILLARQLEARRWRPLPAVAVLAMTALTATSDHLYLVHAAGLAMALVFSSVFTRGARVPAFANVLGIGLGAAVVPWLDKLPARFGIEVDPHPPAFEFTWKRVLYVLDRLPPPDHEPTAVALYATLLVLALLLAGSFCAMVMVGRAEGPRSTRSTLAFLAGAFVATIASVFFANAFSGAYWNEYSARYMHALHLMPYLVVPIAWLLARGPVVRVMIPAVIAAVPLVNGWPKVVDSMKPLLADSALYPASIGCVDAIARRYGVRFGYADYWYARRIADLSRTALHLVAMTPSFEVGDGLCNRRWYGKVADASKFLVITNRLDAATVTARFGAPAHVESCDACCTLAGPDGGCEREQIWIYDARPSVRIVP